MVEGRNGKNGSSANRVQPREIGKGVALIFYVANTCGLLIWIVGNLIVVAAYRCDQAELVSRSFVKSQ